MFFVSLFLQRQAGVNKIHGSHDSGNFKWDIMSFETLAGDDILAQSTSVEYSVGYLHNYKIHILAREKI